MEKNEIRSPLATANFEPMQEYGNRAVTCGTRTGSAGDCRENSNTFCIFLFVFLTDQQSYGVIEIVELQISTPANIIKVNIRISFQEEEDERKKERVVFSKLECISRMLCIWSLAGHAWTDRLSFPHRLCIKLKRVSEKGFLSDDWSLNPPSLGSTR